MLLMLDTISKSYGDHQVLDRVSLTLAEGQKLGLVGANGVGKSTLLKIVTGEIEPDRGWCGVRPAVGSATLPQVLQSAADQTVDELIRTALGDLTKIEARLRELEAAMAAPRRRTPPIWTGCSTSMAGSAKPSTGAAAMTSTTGWMPSSPVCRSIIWTARARSIRSPAAKNRAWGWPRSC